MTLLVVSWDEAYYAWVINETSEQTPWRPILWPFKLIVPVACLLLLVQGVSETIKSLWAARTGIELDLCAAHCDLLIRAWVASGSRGSAAPHAKDARPKRIRPSDVGIGFGSLTGGPIPRCRRYLRLMDPASRVWFHELERSARSSNPKPLKGERHDHPHCCRTTQRTSN